jgi:hypothetical protein
VQTFAGNYWLSQLSDVGPAMLVRSQWQEGLGVLRTGEVSGAVADPMALLPAGADVRLDQQEGSDRVVVAAWPGQLACVEVQRNMTKVSALGADTASTEALLERLVTAAQAVTEPPTGSVRVRFWSFRNGSGEASSRRISAPTWGGTAADYAATTAAGLSPLMAMSGLTGRAGRLVLWHGVPGTGKTTAVRTLSREWSSWCRTHYVMDPERLFAEPHYLLDVAGAGEDDDDLFEDPDDDVDAGPEDRQWRLVVAEDCDEYLRADARERAGASLGRLLNLCDGILGHGLRVVVLLTTNEDVGRLHPAITRPGRCLNQVEFLPLSAPEAHAWLGHDAATAPERPMTLAELYAVREQRSTGPVEALPPLGGYL